MWDVTLLIKDGLSEFQISTHTSRVGCDPKGQNRNGLLWYFYSHIPCGMWQRCLDNLDWSKNISTHTSRVGCDDIVSLIFSQHVQISTHTSRVGCDNCYLSLLSFCNISTHTSRVGCDERKHYYGLWFFKFLLTHPVWDVTLVTLVTLLMLSISTHTSRVGCDEILRNKHFW